MELIIGIILGIAGIAISIFGVDIRHIVSSWTSKDPIIGIWDAKWVTDQDGHVIEDTFSIASCVKGYFRGSGENESFGSYEVRGYRSETSIAFTFAGKGAKSTLLGSVTMDGRGIMEDEIEGWWCNVSTKGELFRGTVRASRRDD